MELFAVWVSFDNQLKGSCLKTEHLRLHIDTVLMWAWEVTKVKVVLVRRLSPCVVLHAKRRISCWFPWHFWFAYRFWLDLLLTRFTRDWYTSTWILRKGRNAQRKGKSESKRTQGVQRIVFFVWNDHTAWAAKPIVAPRPQVLAHSQAR